MPLSLQHRHAVLLAERTRDISLITTVVTEVLAANPETSLLDIETALRAANLTYLVANRTTGGFQIVFGMPAQQAALADIFLGRAGGTVARLYGPAIGEVCAVRPARITLEHVAARKRIDVVGYLHVEAEGDASEPGDVQCGIPGFDHPGTELHGDSLQSTDPALRWEVRGRRNAAFATDFDYRSAP